MILGSVKVVKYAKPFVVSTTAARRLSSPVFKVRVPTRENAFASGIVVVDVGCGRRFGLVGRGRAGQAMAAAGPDRRRSA